MSNLLEQINNICIEHGIEQVFSEVFGNDAVVLTSAGFKKIPKNMRSDELCLSEEIAERDYIAHFKEFLNNYNNNKNNNNKVNKIIWHKNPEVFAKDVPSGVCDGFIFTVLSHFTPCMIEKTKGGSDDK